MKNLYFPYNFPFEIQIILGNGFYLPFFVRWLISVKIISTKMLFAERETRNENEEAKAEANKKKTK